MKHRARRGFTLIEILVCIVIVSILAVLAGTSYSAARLMGMKTESTAKLRQWGVALTAYTADNNGVLPTEGSSSPAWNDGVVDAWYNALPHLMDGKGIVDYSAANAADFYAKSSLFSVSAAKQPPNKSSPYFAIAFCSKLNQSGFTTGFVRVQNMQSPAQTVVFQESGLPGETIQPGQSSYNGQSKTFASRTAFRYGGKTTVMVFGDGHVESFGVKDILQNGKAYNPQSNGKVFWTLDPSINANN